MTIKDSGTRDQFSTGAVRDAEEGKGAFHLLPFNAIWAVSMVFEAGAKKYGARNWEKGIPTHRFVDSAMRHLFKWCLGWRDEPHLAMFCWNALCLLETWILIEQGELPAELNTMPNRKPNYGNSSILARGTGSESSVQQSSLHGTEDESAKVPSDPSSLGDCVFDLQTRWDETTDPLSGEPNGVRRSFQRQIRDAK